MTPASLGPAEMEEMTMTDTRTRRTARTLVPVLSGFALLGMALAGCSHTASGVAQDAHTDTQKVGAAANNAAAATDAAAQNAKQDTTRAVRNADAGVAVTPEVKTAIVRDPILNDPANLINVESANHVTHLTGHVTKASMKARATEDAQAALAKHNKSYRVSNELTVGGG